MHSTPIRHCLLGLRSQFLGYVTDAANNSFNSRIEGCRGVTLSRLVPLPDGKLSHNVKVIVLAVFLKRSSSLARRAIEARVQKWTLSSKPQATPRIQEHEI